MGSFIKCNEYRNHPSIGLEVTVAGKHPLHGLNAVIRDIAKIDEIGPVSYIVEVDATHRKETIQAMNLAIWQYVLFFRAVTNVLKSESYFRNVYPNRWQSWATETFRLNSVQPSMKIHQPRLPLVPSIPLVPSTPIPEGQVFGSPAWQPGSRTPGRSVERELSDRRDFVPHPQIPKPRGRAARTLKYLQEALKVDIDVFSAMRVSFNGRRSFSFN